MKSNTDRWVTCQIGAREHYAIPRALYKNGLLQSLCTDAWAEGLMRSCSSLFGTRGSHFSGRYHSDIPRNLVKHWSIESLWRQLTAKTAGVNRYHRFISEGEWFGRNITAWLDSEAVKPDVLFSYDTTALESFEWAKAHGIRAILGQIDPAGIESTLVEKERESWPGWEPSADPVPEAYQERRAREWELADRIIVNSRWTKSALIQQGVAPEKLVVIPLVYEPQQDLLGGVRRSPGRGPLRLLFLGQVNLRKGIPYLLEAARLANKAVDVTVVGPVKIAKTAVSSAPHNVRFTGPCNRDQVAYYYQQADAFVLPTLSDGFAITQLEAMAYGLPVITTPNCGEVVSDTIDGLVVPARDSEALATAIESLATDRTKLVEMGANAFVKSKQFTIDRLSRDLALV
jgi:glycosyltransferase involved in cell wall biosynthesis